MSGKTKQVLCAAVMVLFSLALLRAATFRFREKQDAIRAEIRANLAKLGLTRDAAKAKFPTPEIGLISGACLAPGGSGLVVVKGKFAPGSKFVFENDNLEVLNENLTPTEYRATLKAAPGIGPQSAGLWVISPSGIQNSHQRAVVVGGSFEWNLETANGWTVAARPVAGKACGEGGSDSDEYDVLFYRKGEAQPFEKRRARLYFSMWEQKNYRFTISNEDSGTRASQEDLMKLMQQMGDPKITNAQREQLMARMEKMQQQMQAQIQALTKDPQAFAQKQEQARQQFGCERIELALQAGAANGELSCSEKVGRRIPVTGRLTLLGAR